MKKILVIVLAIMLALALSLPAMPAMATDVNTSVTISSGGGNIPVVKAKWEQDLTTSLEDGDPSHSSPGSSFNPPGTFEGKKTVCYWAIITDVEDGGNVQQAWVDVYHPAGPPLNGSFKYEIPLTKVDKFQVGIPAFTAAYNAGLIKFNSGFAYADVLEQLNKCVAEVWMGCADLDYCQPGGDYLVKAFAQDHNNNNSVSLDNTFLYVPTCVIEIDFDSLDYGPVNISTNKWIPGDTVFNSPVAAAPNPNPATVRNIGNTNSYIKVYDTDMGFGKDVAGNWNVKFDARMGNNPANEVIYNPETTTQLPNALGLCNKDELDFSIHVIKAMSQSYSGKKTITCAIAPF